MASALYLPLATSGWLFQIWFNRRGVPVGYSKTAALLNFMAQIAASALLLATALGYAAGREFGFYLGAVLLMLFHTSVLFVRLLITSFRSGEPAS
jgi:hypothetical protein